MERKDKILEYIEEHLGCTKTNLESGIDMAAKTVRKYLKELIEEDKKVICIIDNVNPRIHHLFINTPVKLAMMNLTLSKAEAQIRRGCVYTIIPTVGGGVIIGSQDGDFYIQRNHNDGIKNLIESASRLKSNL